MSMHPEIRCLYLAGPMRGKEHMNFPAFTEAATELRDAGYIVFNPAEHDVANGFDPDADEPMPLCWYMQHDLPEVCKADAVAVLPGWGESQGASLEVYVAHKLGKGVFDCEDLLADDDAEDELYIEEDTDDEVE